MLPVVFGGCLSFIFRPSRGVVTSYSGIPSSCTTTLGLKQKVVKQAQSEDELIRHYGLTFLVRFQDGESPALYGTVYHQDPDANKYCMALPDGRFATYTQSKIGVKDNMYQEICYPLRDCLQEVDRINY